MKTKSIAAFASLLLLASTGAAVAAPGELYPESVTQYHATPGKTRAQVVEELTEARTAGQIADGEVGYAFGTPAEQNGKQASALAGNKRSRQAVHAEAVQSAHAGYAVSASLRTN